MKKAFVTPLYRNKRKVKRSFLFQKSTHLVLRLKECLPPLFDPYDRELKHFILQLSSKYNIRIYRLIFNHTHMHAVLLLPDRSAYVKFIRELTSFMVQHFTQRLNIPGVIFRKIFSSRPFTRSVPWGRAFKVLLNYMKKNELESGVEQPISWHALTGQLQLTFAGTDPPDQVWGYLNMRYYGYINHALLWLYQTRTALALSNTHGFGYINHALHWLYQSCTALALSNTPYFGFIKHALLWLYQTRTALALSNTPYFGFITHEYSSTKRRQRDVTD